MKLKTKAILLICLTVAALCVICGCADKSIFEGYDDDGYTVSVRFDANGGTMMTQVTAIVDTFNISEMKTNSDGQVEIALLDPRDERRGNGNVCTPSYAQSGYYLAGWYTERTENPNGEGYVYANPWNFETDRVRVNPNDDNTSSSPVLTLYAVWKPLLVVEVVDRATNTTLDTLTYDPKQDQVRMPEWKKDGTGSIDMNGFPEKEGYTFDAAYYDAEGTRKIDTEVLIHTAETDENATSMKIYVDWLEGEWFHIYSAKQFVRKADSKGNYLICADLDFSKVDWPTAFMYEKFEGTICTLDNQQFTLSNITAVQDRDKANAGLFGWISENAKISNVTFDNVTFTVQKGSIKQCYYGLFSGSISENASIENVSITNGTLVIDSAIATTNTMPYENYVLGLVCAEGNSQCLVQAEIDCSVADNDKFSVAVDGNEVSITAK